MTTGILLQRAFYARTGIPIASRPQRPFTIEHYIIFTQLEKVTAAKFNKVFKKMRALFIDEIYMPCWARNGN